MEAIPRELIGAVGDVRYAFGKVYFGRNDYGKMYLG
jgi:hypothetical protein